MAYPSRATSDSINKLLRNPRARLSPRDDLRVASFLDQNVQPIDQEDVSVQEYITLNDGGMASKTRVY
tara:strand:+ start:304 stop:507 length:204 start_codon:yes stop_codon:yes gene_type:complete